MSRIAYPYRGVGAQPLALDHGIDLRLDDLRPDHRVARLLTDLRRQPAVTVRELKPLSRAETDALVARIAGPPATPERNALLWRRSRGIPFLVEALALAERDRVGGLPE